MLPEVHLVIFRGTYTYLKETLLFFSVSKLSVSFRSTFFLMYLMVGFENKIAG